MWVNSNMQNDYREILNDIMTSVPVHRQTDYKKFINYIEKTLLDFGDPNVLEVKCHVGNDFFNIDIMIRLGFFNFVAYRPKNEDLYQRTWDMKFLHSYMTDDKIYEYSKKKFGTFENDIFKAIFDEWDTIIKETVDSLCIYARRKVTVEQVLNSIDVNNVTLANHIQNLTVAVDALLTDSSIENQQRAFYNKIQAWIDEYDWSDLDDSRPYFIWQQRVSPEPKERVPVQGYVYLVKSNDLNLYGFRKSDDHIHPELYAQLTFANKKHPLETVSYFENHDVNKMIRFVKKKYESKMVDNYYRGITFVKWEDLSGLNWYDLSDADISEIMSDNFSTRIQEELSANEKKKLEVLSPGGFIVLFKNDLTNVYHLRTTAKADPRYLIYRGGVYEKCRPVIGFLTKDLDKLKAYFQNSYRGKRDFTENGNKEKYLLNDEDISQIRLFAQNKDLQISELIEPKKHRGSVIFEAKAT